MAYLPGSMEEYVLQHRLATGQADLPAVPSKLGVPQGTGSQVRYSGPDQYMRSGPKPTGALMRPVPTGVATIPTPQVGPQTINAEYTTINQKALPWEGKQGAPRIEYKGKRGPTITVGPTGDATTYDEEVRSRINKKKGTTASTAPKATPKVETNKVPTKSNIKNALGRSALFIGAGMGERALMGNIPKGEQQVKEGDYDPSRIASVAAMGGAFIPDARGRALMIAPLVSGLAAKAGYQSTGEGITAQQEAEEIKRMNEASARAQAVRKGKQDTLREATPDELRDFILANQGTDTTISTPTTPDITAFEGGPLGKGYIEAGGKRINYQETPLDRNRELARQRLAYEQEQRDTEDRRRTEAHMSNMTAMDRRAWLENDYKNAIIQKDYKRARELASALGNIGTLQSNIQTYGSQGEDRAKAATTYAALPYQGLITAGNIAKTQADTRSALADAGYKEKQTEGYDTAQITERLKATAKVVPPHLESAYKAWEKLHEAGSIAEADEMAKQLYVMSGGSVTLPLASVAKQEK